MTPRQGSVAAPHTSGGNRRAESPVGQVGLGHDHETGRVPIQPVDDAGAAFSPSSQRGAPGDEGVYQGVIPMTGCGVDDQSSRFVDDSKMLVFENEAERD